MKIAFCVILFVCLGVVSTVALRGLLYRLQLEGYSRVCVLKYYKFLLVALWPTVIVSILFMTCVFAYGIADYYILCSFLIVVISLQVLLIFKSFNKAKLVVTKRVVRIVGVSVFLHSAVFLLVCCFAVDWILLIFGFCGVFLLPCFVYIALVFLHPIEILIGRYYISNAKKILSNNKGLVKIAITGSYGKTSVKEILSSILSSQYSVLATPKSYNTPFGITKTINGGLSNSHEIFVCEMGAKKLGEIRELCEIVSPDIGIVTAVGRQHVNTFGSIDNVFKTKKELPDYLFNKRCVFNLDNKYVKDMFDGYTGVKIGVYVVDKLANKLVSPILKNVSTVFVYGARLFSKKFYMFPKGMCVYARNIALSDEGSSFDVYVRGSKYGRVDTSLIGVHNITNILLSIAVAAILGESWNNILLGLGGVSSISARLERFVTSRGAIVLNNGYNSNLDSASSSLSVLDLFDKKRKIVITPGLVETGDDGTYNRKFGELVAKHATDVVIVKEKNRGYILLGLSNSCFDMSRVCYVNNFEEARTLINNATNDDVVLIENDLPDNYK